MMHKVALLIQREYSTRVRKKSFLLATLITPLLFPAIMGGILWLAMSEGERSSLRIIEVVDEQDFFFLESMEQYAFSYGKISLEEAKELVRKGERFGLLHIPPLDMERPRGISFYSEVSPPLSFTSMIEASLKRRIEDSKLQNSGIDPSILQAVRTPVSLDTITLASSGDEVAGDARIQYGIGFISGILIYLFIFLYSNQIMQGVIEEKSSRIMEVLVATMRPFQLMLGKIIGIAAVGLTQFGIWVLLISLLSSLLWSFFGIRMPQAELLEAQGLAADSIDPALTEGPARLLMPLLQVDYGYILSIFLFYFLGGYLLYGALFAAIGAAVDTPADAQQFVLPVTIPLLVAYMGLFLFVLQDPNSSTSFYLSVFPLTSPIAMVGRAAYGIPFWELLLSMSLLILGFIGSTWVAAKIYKIGILAHGAKVNFKVLWSWLKRED
ncbi:MAG: ABC transporter permease [Nitritalea sp.]